MDYKQFNEMFPLSEKCWKGYKQLGMKDKDGKKVPNCVKEEDILEKSPSPEEIEKFHTSLDKLVHDTFGERPEEKNCDSDKKDKVVPEFKKKSKQVELNPKIENGTT